MSSSVGAFVKSVQSGSVSLGSMTLEMEERLKLEAVAGVHRAAQPGRAQLWEVSKSDSEVERRDGWNGSPISGSDSGPSDQSSEDDYFDEEETERIESMLVMPLQLEAMTWASMAKDFTISSLGRRLRQALEIAKKAQEKNRELEVSLRESKEREEAAVRELVRVKEEKRVLEEAEERFSTHVGNMEAEAVEEHRAFRRQISALTERIKAQDHFIAHSLKTVKPDRPDQVYFHNSSVKVPSDPSKAKDNEQSLTTDPELAMSPRELEPTSDIPPRLVSAERTARKIEYAPEGAEEVLRRGLGRRMKLLEKERRRC